MLSRPRAFCLSRVQPVTHTRDPRPDLRRVRDSTTRVTSAYRPSKDIPSDTPSGPIRSNPRDLCTIASTTTPFTFRSVCDRRDRPVVVSCPNYFPPGPRRPRVYDEVSTRGTGYAIRAHAHRIVVLVEPDTRDRAAYSVEAGIIASRSEQPATMSKLYVGNLPSDCNESALRQLFQEHSLACTTILVKRGGYAFVDCADQSTADRAIDKLNGELLT